MGLVGFTVKEFDVSSQWVWKKGARESEGFEMAMAGGGAYFVYKYRLRVSLLLYIYVDYEAFIYSLVLLLISLVLVSIPQLTAMMRLINYVVLY